MRIDVYLSENGFARSRSEAKSMISSGLVSVSGKKILKPSFDVGGKEGEVSVDKREFMYVSRGGYKLKAALDNFKIDVFGKCAVDVGASSGGFTDCLLQNGAKKVFAVDSGTMQLNSSLREDPRVSVMENFNARYMTSNDFSENPNLAVMDVSFISATYIIPTLSPILSSGDDFICLIKPQFEVGREGLSKGGIVKDEKLRASALKKVTSFAEEFGFDVVAEMESPIKGGDGNTEYLVHFKKR